MSAALPVPQRVLIVRPSSLGDVISALPVLGGLRRTFPRARVAWLATPACAGILEGQGLDEIIPFEMGRALFDAATTSKNFWPVAGAGHNDIIITRCNHNRGILERRKNLFVTVLTPTKP